MSVAKMFIRAAQKTIASKLFFGNRESILVSGCQFLYVDAPLAREMGRDLILAWIQAMSEMIPRSHKKKRAFVREWQSCMWEGEEIVNPIPEPPSLTMPPIYGVSKVKVAGPKKSIDELVADFGSTIT